jgi:hypothetical protein
MVAIVTLLLAFPLGFLIPGRLGAYLAYVAVFGYAFTFQTSYLLRAALGDGDTSAFPADPNDPGVQYLIVTAAIYAVGFGLVSLGHHLGARRR